MGVLPFNKQPWRLIVITDKAQLGRVHDAMSDWNRLWITRAPLLFAVLVNPEEGDEPDGRHQYMMDCGLAIENLLLMGCAPDLAIHAVVGWSEPRIKEVLEVPQPFRVVAFVAVGYPGTAGFAPRGCPEP